MFDLQLGSIWRKHIVRWQHLFRMKEVMSFLASLIYFLLIQM